MDHQRSNILTDLYHGNFIPEDLVFSNAPPNPGNAELIELQNKIRDSVSSEVWKMINQSYSMINMQEVLAKERVFVCGFQTATKLLLAGIGHDITDIDFAK